jgi:putative addiction module CopG family antidote
MTLSLPPEIQKFIDEQVQAGRFSSPEAVVAAAIAEMRQSDDELDDDTIAAINEGLEQADRGEGIELDEFRARMMKRISGK